MAKPSKGRGAIDRVVLNYELIRNTTSSDEKKTNVVSYVANLPAMEILKLNTKDNLRTYIAEHNPRKRNRVHDAIQQTICNEPARFITRNGGLVITASRIKVDDAGRSMVLDDASIINGAQTQGEVRRWFEENAEDWEGEETPFHIRAEIIVDPDADEIVETAIARNTATPVKSLSQAGARGHLDDLQASISRMFPQDRIRKSETDENVIDTRNILQFARLLMPVEVSGNTAAAEKLRAYKNPEQCLTDFSSWYEARETDPVAARKYEFTVQIAPYALKEYRYWDAHGAWNGHRLWEQTSKGGRAVRRDGEKIVWVASGILYPLVGAISEFVVRDELGRWTISKPTRFNPDEMVKRAVAQFRAHSSNPMLMGRSEAAYDALRIYPQTLVQILREMGEPPIVPKAA